ncbi:NAD(P)H-quinone oxidoreductase [Rheinheimera sp. 4Y26]|uniref:NAD(P)H-quinone oxidoreductase n=1 Tax=Rheinheimera sp. 4Y26 TaxID=2977811 RepID=UPI0021B0EDD3|nr:NAD(P)H-quinone oxidoreductase [Rheinheimera sp. 4Y26]MCT6699446.1 NAD(P)H-quinone oxidoreductase [Rheinheimera sp. 4Y26]
MSVLSSEPKIEKSAVSALMRAIDVENQGSDSRLVFKELPVPVPGASQVLVKVVAAGVNRADLAQRAGIYPPPAGESPILGLEVAGTVVAVGDSTLAHWLGQEVFGLVPGGGYAEYALLHSGHLLKRPETLSTVEAAATAEVFLTAYQAMFELGGLTEHGRSQAQSCVLIHAGASGVGTAAIQLAKLQNAVVAVTVGSDDKADACYKLGADFCINYKKADFVTELKAAVPQGFDVIIDPVAGDYIPKNVQLLAQDGRIVVLAMMGGRQVPAFDLAPMFKKRGQLLCSTLRNRSDDYKTALCRAFHQQFGEALASGTIKPVLAQVLDWQQAEQSHQLLASNAVVGKLVLSLSPQQG